METHAAISMNDDAARVAAMRTEFDHVYASGIPSSKHGKKTTELSSDELQLFDYTQWTDSFNLAQLPTDHMDSWRRATVDRILQGMNLQQAANNQSKQHPPVDATFSVHEIGSGTGLILFELLSRPQLSNSNQFSYVGIELSSQCVDGLLRRVTKFTPNHSDRIRVRCAAAHEVEYKSSTSSNGKDAQWFVQDGSVNNNKLFNVLIINSVVVYYPSLAYFHSTFLSSLNHLSEGGIAFVGDNRDSRSVRVFYAAIALHRDPEVDLESPAVLQRLDASARTDPHLLLSPADFIQLSERCENVCSVLIQPKLSPHSYRLRSDAADEFAQNEPIIPDNEMTRFRYDVTMHMRDSPLDHSSVTNVSIPLLSNGAVDPSATTLHAYPWRQEVESARGARGVALAAASHASQLHAFWSQHVTVMQSDSQSYFLFSYPHLPVLHDALTVEQAFDREQWQMKPTLATAAARILFTPLQLIEAFDATDHKSLQLEVTLDPFDATALICIVHPRNKPLRVQYTRAPSPSTTKLQGLASTPSSATSPFSCSSASPVATESTDTAPSKQAHWRREQDVLDRLTRKLWQKINAHSLSSFPNIPARSIPAMLWSSLLAQEANGRGEEIAIVQVLRGYSSQEDDQGPRERAYTWLELSRRVAFVADYMRTKLGIRAGDKVLQCVDRSLEQLVGMLATFVAGAVYVPLAAAPQPDPVPRLASIITDSCARHILTQPAHQNHLEQAVAQSHAEDSSVTAPAILCVEELDQIYATSPFVTESASMLAEQGLAAAASIDPVSLAYCIYTSGSTGRPKGVQLSHANFFHLLLAFDEMGFAATQINAAHESLQFRMLQTTAPTFDLHVYECLAPLLTPALTLQTKSSSSSVLPRTELVLLRPGGHQDLEYYVAAIALRSITHVVCTPSMLRVVAEHCTINGCWALLSSVKVWRMGGEALPQSLVDMVLPKLRAQQPLCKLICSYGPAECTDTATVWEAEISSQIPRSLVLASEGKQELAEPYPIVSIGLPLPRYGVHILVEEEEETLNVGRPKLRCARPGEIGMLYLSGVGVFMGYLSRPDLTDSVLVRDRPDLAGHSGPMYRTGDLAKLCYVASPGTEGTLTLGRYALQFVGRVDFAQVKIRGQRIEVGEVESAFGSHGMVLQVLVMKRTRGTSNDYLAAYILLKTAANGSETSSVRRQLYLHAQSLLPAHMVPSSITIVERFPTSRNGKTDRSLLPEPETDDFIATEISSSEEDNTCATESDASSSSSAPVDDKLSWLRAHLYSIWMQVLSPSTSSESDAARAHPAISFEMGAEQQQQQVEEAQSHASLSPPSDILLKRSWLESGATSLHLMRFLSMLRRFVSQNRWSDKTEANAAVNSLLLFPRLYRMRNIETLATVLLPHVRKPGEAVVPEPVQSEIASGTTETSSTQVESPSASPSASPVSPETDSNPSSPTGSSAQISPASDEPESSGLRSISVPHWSCAKASHATCPQQGIVVIDELLRFWEKPSTIYASPYVLRVSPSTNGSNKFTTVKQARTTLARMQQLLHRLVELQPALRIAFSFDARNIQLTQHVFSLDEPSHRDDTQFVEHIVRASPSNPQGGWKPDDYVLQAGEAAAVIQPRDELGAALEMAAQEPLWSLRSAPHKSLFRFHSFIELAADASSDDEDAQVLSLHLMLNVHHIVFDGESIQILLRQLVQLARGDSISPSLGYFDYCRWFQSSSFASEHGESLTYWAEHLSAWNPSSHVQCQPFSTAEGIADKEFTAKARKLRRHLSVEQLRRMQALGRCINCTNYIILLTCFYVMLYSFKQDNLDRFSAHPLWSNKQKQEAETEVKESSSSSNEAKKDEVQEGEELDLSVGSAMANREPHFNGGIDLSETCCLLANCVPFRQRVRPRTLTFDQFLHKVSDSVLDHLSHQSVPYGVLLMLVDGAQGSKARESVRGPCRNPFFSSALLYEQAAFLQTVRNLPLDSAQPETNVDLQLLELPDFGAIFEIQLKVNEVALPPSEKTSSHSSSGETPLTVGLQLTYEYAEQLFTDEAISVADQRFHALLDLLTSTTDASDHSGGSPTLERVAETIRKQFPLM